MTSLFLCWVPIRTKYKTLARQKLSGYYKPECDISYEETVDVYKQKYGSSNQEVQLLIHSCKNKCDRKTTKFLRNGKGYIHLDRIHN